MDDRACGGDPVCRDGLACEDGGVCEGGLVREDGRVHADGQVREEGQVCQDGRARGGGRACGGDEEDEDHRGGGDKDVRSSSVQTNEHARHILVPRENRNRPNQCQSLVLIGRERGLPIGNHLGRW